MDIINLIASLISGAIGGNMVGGALNDQSLGLGSAKPAPSAMFITWPTPRSSREPMWLLKPGLPWPAAWVAWCCAIKTVWFCTYARHPKAPSCS